MIFRQFLNPSTIAASYLLGRAGRGEIVIVDPLDNIEVYLHASRDAGMRIVSVIDTHVHADHLSGGRALAEATGASYLVHESAVVTGADAVNDGQDLTAGNVILRVLATPGSTP